MNPSDIIKLAVVYNKKIQIRVRTRPTPCIRSVQVYTLEHFRKQLSEFMSENLEKFCLLFGVHETIITPPRAGARSLIRNTVS